MRGEDVPYNPFFYSYTLLTMDEIWLDLLLGFSLYTSLTLHPIDVLFPLSLSTSAPLLGCLSTLTD